MRVEKIGLATLYLGDCREIAPTLERPAAVISDPPYGIGFAAQPTKWQRRAGKAPEAWDDAPDAFVEGLPQAADVVALWGGNYYRLPPSRGWLAWRKPDAPPSMASFEMCWTNRDQNAREIVQSISATNAERVGHPTQKPIAVMRFTIDAVRVPPGGVILDPYMGSGSTGVAAVEMRHPFVGIEIEERYFSIACRRIEAAQRQGDMFRDAEAVA
jgi:site-specific DNA-methyltransferase (adenine-specific)